MLDRILQTFQTLSDLKSSPVAVDCQPELCVPDAGAGEKHSLHLTDTCHKLVHYYCLYSSKLDCTAHSSWSQSYAQSPGRDWNQDLVGSDSLASYAATCSREIHTVCFRVSFADLATTVPRRSVG